MVKQLTMFEAPTPEPEDNSEWYTPKEIIEAAREALGVIDLDPASCAMAQRVVRAKTFYTRADNGLSLPWHGCVWLNPPYGRGVIESFVAKLLSCLHERYVPRAICLTNNCTETQWWQELAAAAEAVCFPRGRVRFWGPLERNNSPTQGQSIFLFAQPPQGGKELEASMELLARFETAFRPLGTIMSCLPHAER